MHAVKVHRPESGIEPVLLFLLTGNYNRLQLTFILLATSPVERERQGYLTVCCRLRLPLHRTDRPGAARGRLGQHWRRMSGPMIEHLFRWRHHNDAGLAIQLHSQAGPDQP